MLSSIIITVKVCAVLYGAVWIFAKLLNPEDAAWVKGKPLAILLTLFAVGMLGHTIWVVYAVLVAILPMTARNRAEAAALFLVANGAVPELSTYLTVGGAAIFAIDKWMCLSIGLLIVFLKEPRTGLRFNGWFDIPFLLMLGLEFVQARDQNFTSTVRSLLTTILAIGLPYFIFTRSIGKVEDMRRVMVALVLIGFVLATIGIFESRMHFLAYQQMYRALNVAGLDGKLFKERGGILRAVTSFGEATGFSQFLAIALIATIAMRYSFRTTSRMVIALGVISVGIFVTSSRNAWIAAGIGVLTFDLYRRRYLALSGKAAVLGMAYTFLVLIAEFSPYVATMMGKSADTAGTADYRSQLLKRGLEEFRKHPYAGLNIQSVMDNMIDMKQGEGIIDIVNAYLFYGLTAGIGGVIALALVFSLPAWAMIVSRKRLSEHLFLERTAAFVFATAIANFITNAFTSFGGRNSTYFYVVLGIGSVMFAWRKVSPDLLSSSDRPPPKRRPPPIRSPLLTLSPQAT